jgi:hypothetical protein
LKNSITILPWHGSADLAALAGANALVRLPSEAVNYPAETVLDAFLI